MPKVTDENGDEWTIIPKRRELPKPPKGVQCGECGMRFEHGKTYGYVCMNHNCPMGFGPITCSVLT